MSVTTGLPGMDRACLTFREIVALAPGAPSWKPSNGQALFPAQCQVHLLSLIISLMSPASRQNRIRGGHGPAVHPEALGLWCPVHPLSLGAFASSLSAPRFSALRPFLAPLCWSGSPGLAGPCHEQMRDGEGGSRGEAHPPTPSCSHLSSKASSHQRTLSRLGHFL